MPSNLAPLSVQAAAYQDVRDRAAARDFASARQQQQQQQQQQMVDPKRSSLASTPLETPRSGVAGYAQQQQGRSGPGNAANASFRSSGPVTQLLLSSARAAGAVTMVPTSSGSQRAVVASPGALVAQRSGAMPPTPAGRAAGATAAPAPTAGSDALVRNVGQALRNFQGL